MTNPLDTFEEQGCENVMAYARSVIHVPNRGIVFNPTILRYFSEPQFLSRVLLEDNPQFKKVVPFILIFTEGTIAVFSINDSTHKLGIYDEVTDDDGDYMTGFIRILHEQLSIKSVSIPSSRIIGVINDETTSFGRTHLGVLHAIHYPVVNPTDPKIEGVQSKMIGFSSLENLLAHSDSFDPWSQICIENFEVLKVPQLGIPL